jgi:hypothetical protein
MHVGIITVYMYVPTSQQQIDKQSTTDSTAVDIQ